MRNTAQRRAPDALKMEEIGKRLRAIRVANGLRSSEMAARLDVERTYWTRWELGNRPIPHDMAWHLTQMFEVDLDYILAGEVKSVPAAVQAKLAAALLDTESEG